ncbi:MAG: arsenic transporter [Janthinobacterium lividum]
MSPTLATCLIAALSTAAVLARPFGLPEAVWAVAGALLLVVLGLLPVHDALSAVAKGGDVYLFLSGMMLLSEIARREGLFDWIAAQAARRANGSALRLFLLIYGVGTVVTAFLSNDATAVVLTPAVLAATKAADVKDPLPYLFACAMIANAASFILPISNPANLVLYASRTPALPTWLTHFALPSLLAVAATYAVLRLASRRSLADPISRDIEQPELPTGGRIAAGGIALTAIVLLAASSFDIALGLPTAIAGALTTIAVLATKREAPWGVLKGVSWAVLPLVAGLFVLVEGLGHTGLIGRLAGFLHDSAASAPQATAWAAGAAIAFGSNLVNNLPAGLVAADVIAQAHPPQAVTDALLVGVDLGPNLSVTGSLATILWLTALRRDGQTVGFWRFLRLGAMAMPPALLLALAGLLLVG